MKKTNFTKLVGRTFSGVQLMDEWIHQKKLFVPLLTRLKISDIWKIQARATTIYDTWFITTIFIFILKFIYQNRYQFSKTIKQ